MNDDLKAVNYFKEFETKHKELKDEFRRVSNDILFLISRLEKLNSELRRLPEKVEQDNSEIFQSFNEVIEKRNEKITLDIRNSVSEFACLYYFAVIAQNIQFQPLTGILVHKRKV